MGRINNILTILKLDNWYMGGEYIQIAKGKYELLPTRWGRFKKFIKYNYNKHKSK